VDRLDEDGQVDFKGKAKVFCRTYSFLSSVIPYSNAEWEKLSILLNLLTPKLPAPQEEDLSKGILEAIDMDSYRVEKKAAMKIALADKDAEIESVPTDVHGHKPEPELDRLSNILKTFNEQFGTLFTDTDRVAKRIRDDIAPKVAADVERRDERVKFLRLKNPQPGRSIGLVFRRTSPRKADFAALGEVVKQSLDMSPAKTVNKKRADGYRKQPNKKGG